jgi:excisionase family DNA binding protein
MLDIEEVAQQLGCTVSGVRKVVARGEIRYFQHGKRGRLKFKPEWVDEFIARHTVAPAGEQPRRVPTKRPGKRKAVESAEEVCGFGWDLLKSPS